MTKQEKTPIITLLLLAWFMLILIGCNLGTSGATQTATLVPSASATPPPTLGYNGGGNSTGINSSINTSDFSDAPRDISVELQNMTQQVSAERLMSHVRQLQGFRTRHVNSSTSSPSDGIGAARTYIYNQFVDIAAQSQGNFIVPTPMEFDITVYNKPTRQQNVIGVLSGTEAGAGVIVIGAHYDSIGPDFSDGNIAAPGANDNGSGVAGLIEMARILSQRKYRSTILFVAFSAEEHNRLGSKAFVQQWAIPQNVDIAAMINIDAIGNNNTRSGEVDNSLRIFSCKGDNICGNDAASRHLARAAELLGFENAAPLEMKVETEADRDGRYGDHFSFAEAGYPAIRFINTLEEWANGSANDTYQYVEQDFLRQAVQSIMIVVVALADGPQPPRQITMRTTDTGVPSLRWEPVTNATGYVIALRYPNKQKYEAVVSCTAATNYCIGTSLTWGELTNYAGVAIAAKGADGLIGRMSAEYALQPGR